MLMKLTCKNIHEIKSCDSLELVTKENFADKAIMWCHFIDNFQLIKTVREDELVIAAGFEKKSEAEVLDFISKLHEKRISCLIVYTSEDNVLPYQKSIEKLGNNLGLCIYSLPARVLLSEITQFICEAICRSKLSQQFIDKFIDLLIFENIEDNSILATKANMLGYDHSQSYYCVNISFDKTDPDTNQMTIKDMIFCILDSVSKQYKTQILHTIHNNNIIVIVNSVKNNDLIDKITSKTLEKLYDSKSIIRASAGISENYSALSQFKQAYTQAESMVRLSSSLGGKQLCYYNADINAILSNIQDKTTINTIYSNMMSKLEDYDNEKGSMLKDTLFSFVENDFNSKNTAEAMHIHLNTLRYRLSRIQEILAIKLREPQNIYKITTAYHIDKYIKSLS